MQHSSERSCIFRKLLYTISHDFDSHLILLESGTKFKFIVNVGQFLSSSISILMHHRDFLWDVFLAVRKFLKELRLYG